MRRTFVVEREFLARMSDAMHATGERLPLECIRSMRIAQRALAIDRPQRVHPEHVLDVGDEELLVLLLVMQPELDERIARDVADRR